MKLLKIEFSTLIYIEFNEFAQEIFLHCSKIVIRNTLRIPCQKNKPVFFI